MNPQGELPATLKIVTVWLLVGIGLFLAVQAWLHNRQATAFDADGGMVQIRRGADGHYHWPGTVNGEPVDFLVDTGASSTALPQALADRLGLRTVGTVRSQTAGGVVTGQVVLADVALQGGVRADRLRAVALAGLGERPLLGMDVLGRLAWRQADGVLVIDLRGNAPP
jgi:aspartyl protease family protein